MASVKRKGDVVRVQLRSEERVILAGLAREVAHLLGGASAAAPDPLEELVGLGDADASAPTDPAVQRLLPAAYDDPAVAAEFRRLTDAELRRGKTAGLTRLADDASGTGELELSDDDAGSWLTAINDIRLVLGVRLGIDDDEHRWRDSIDPDDARAPLVAAYDWLSMLQELLISALGSAPHIT